MNIIMSRAAHQHHLSRGLLPDQGQLHQLSPRAGGADTTSSPTSPLDFTDRIPFEELRLSSERLGSGSFGTVFKGRWRGRLVAVKQFKTREEIDSAFVEVKQLSCVKHPNIVTLYGASTLSHSTYLIMEYAEGGSLNHLLHECKQQEYDLRHACSWAMQTARGVAYLHTIRPKPIMHRDLKPANLLLFSRGKILKICDFGTACAVKTKMTANTGSALYMAPEVFTSDSYLESGDVFSWSIIFWEILVRNQPYNKQYSSFQLMWKVYSGERPAEIEGCPQPIWDLLTRSWNKEVAKRPSMHEVAKEIEFIFSLTERRSRNDNQSAAKSRNQTPTGSNSQDVTDRNIQTAALGPKAISPISLNNHHQFARDGSGSPLPSISSPVERPSNSRLTTSDHIFMQQHNITTAASTSTSHRFEQQHFQDQPFSEQHYQHYHNQLSRQQEQSIRSYSLKANRVRALHRHVELLQRRFVQLQQDIKSDKKNTASVSFEEFEGLKRRIKSMRQLIKENNQHQICSLDSTPQEPEPCSPVQEGGEIW